MPPDPDQLKAALNRTHAELERTLAEACDEQDVSGENTGELIRLEELLNDAATSAKRAISLRRRLGAERATREPGTPQSPEGQQSGDDAPVASEKIREITDTAGKVWRVWEVPPEQLDRTRPGAYAAYFEKGWLCFEAADGQERRRLPLYPANWPSLPNAELRALMAQARPATPRRRRGSGGPPDEKTERGNP